MDLYNYIFHYNDYSKSWYGFKREDMTEYFNGNLKVAVPGETCEAVVHKIRNGIV